MPLKDRFRKALSRSTTTTRSNSSASSDHPSLTTSATNPISIKTTTTNTSANTSPLSATSSRLSKRLTWRSDRSSPSKPKGKENANWEDDKKWEVKPHKREAHDLLKGFEWKWRSSMDGGRAADLRRSSGYSGVSPGCSRVASVDDAAGLGRSGSLNGRRGTAGERRKSGKDVGVVVEE